MNEPTTPAADNKPSTVTVSISICSFAELIRQLDELDAKMAETIALMRVVLR